MTQTNFLTLEQILAIHDNQIELYGGSHGIRDLGLLEAAIARPQSSFDGRDFYQDIFLKAASLMYGLMMNHPFLDGNKRTAVTSAAGFLFLNGFELVVGQKDMVNIALEVESKKVDLEKLATWIKNNSKKV